MEINRAIFTKNTEANKISIDGWQKRLSLKVIAKRLQDVGFDEILMELFQAIEQHHEVLTSVHEMWCDGLDERPHPVKEGGNVVALIIKP